MEKEHIVQKIHHSRRLWKAKMTATFFDQIFFLLSEVSKCVPISSKPLRSFKGFVIAKLPSGNPNVQR
jgi:hypothetical protein